jgi:hypothetical protein
MPEQCAICLEDDVRIKPDACHAPTAYNHSGPCVKHACNVAYKTPCGHSFHRCCLLHLLWTETGCDVDGEEGTIACPLCRKPFTMRVCDSV